MDLLFKRYASPFDYLDTLIDNGILYKGILNIVKNDNEDKMWEMYLHSNPYIAPQKTFKEWKEKAFQNENHKKPLSKVELKTELEKSQNLLNQLSVKVVTTNE